MAGRSVTRLIDKRRCGDDVVTARFERPSGFAFVPGQWIRLTLGTSEGEQTRTLSIASARGDDWLEVTTRLSASPFKQALDALEPRGQAFITGPGGRMSLPDGAERAAFLIGGVGVTPARSILRDAQQREHAYEDVLVLYGSKDPACVPYLDEFEAMRPIGVRTVPVYEDAEPDWPGETGFISAETVRRHVDPGDGRPFIVAGPPVMVAAMKQVLDELEIGEDRRRIEWFGTPSGQAADGRKGESSP